MPKLRRLLESVGVLFVATLALGCPARSNPIGFDSGFVLPVRQGERPRTSDAPPGTNLAHRQLTQNAPVDLQEELHRRMTSLPNVTTGRSRISVPGARAIILPPEHARGGRSAFLVGGEFVHIHPHDDGSLHVRLPPEWVPPVFEKGWGEPHPRSGTPLLYGPRNAAELEVVWQLILRSYCAASRHAACPP